MKEECKEKFFQKGMDVWIKLHLCQYLIQEDVLNVDVMFIIFRYTLKQIYINIKVFYT